MFGALECVFSASIYMSYGAVLDESFSVLIVWSSDFLTRTIATVDTVRWCETFMC